MHLRRFLHCLVLLCSLTLLQVMPMRAAEIPNTPKVLAFYYTWYGTPDLQGHWVHWNEGGRNPDRLDSQGWPEIGATHHPPRLYDSNDPETIRQHLKLAADSGIDVFVSTWWRQGDYHDKAFRKVIREAENSPVKLTVYYETVPAVGASEKEQLIEGVVNDLRYILDSYADSPAFFKVDGKPVIFVYGRTLAQMDRESWMEAVRRIKDSHPVILIGDSASPDWLTVFDGLHDYNPVGAVVAGSDMQEYYQRRVSACRSAGKIAAVTVIPGYDDSRIGRTTPIVADREESVLYRRLWAQAIRSSPDWILITSFNEWHEGSEIEPSRELGSLYMGITSQYAAAFKRSSPDGTADAGASWQADVNSPENLVYDLAPRIGGGWLLSNLDTRRGTIRVPAKPWRRPMVFELGKEDRHLRRVYPRLKAGQLHLRVAPFSVYELHDADEFADAVLKNVCRCDPSGLTKAQRLKCLGSALREPGTSKPDAETAYHMRLISEAYQALLGLDFECEMSYRAVNPAADYKVFAGRDFELRSTVANRGTELLASGTVRLLAPDEWSVSPVSGRVPAFDSLAPGRSATASFKIRAPGRSTFRPKRFPVIAELLLTHADSRLTLHYPCEVELADPITPSLRITSADPDCVKTVVALKSLFADEVMKDVAVYPFMAQNIKVEPARPTLTLKGTAQFPVSYKKTGAPGFALRAVTLAMKVDEHIVRLRSVMEAVLPLGEGTRASGLWMNQCDDGLVSPAEVGSRACRQTVRNPLGDTRYVYFAVSENFPIVGNSYVSVTYFDGTEGSFTLQYDSADPAAPMDGAYKDAREVVRLEGTGEWKQKTFVVPDAGFSNRQNSKSDLRLAVFNTDLAIAEIALSKFAPDRPR